MILANRLRDMFGCHQSYYPLLHPIHETNVLGLWVLIILVDQVVSPTIMTYQLGVGPCLPMDPIGSIVISSKITDMHVHIYIYTYACIRII